MADSYDNSVWVSGLTPPVTKDLCKFFSRIAPVEQMVVPKTDVGACLIQFDNKDAAIEALTYHGRSYRDCKLEITRPTIDQLESLQDEAPTSDAPKTSSELLKDSLSTMDPQDMLKMLGSLTEWAKSKITISEAAQKSDDPAGADGHSPASQDGEEYRHKGMDYNSHHTTGNPNSGFYFVPNNSGAPGTSMSGMGPPPIWAQPIGHYPKITFFSGDGGNDAPYMQWRNEVRCLMTEGHGPANILQGIRRSLKGTAAEVLLNMGAGVTPSQILEKFDIIFGNALTSEVLLEDFYRARQNEGEKAVVWGCRLERLLNNVRDRGLVPSNAQDMLRNRFWGGMSNDHMKNALRHRFDNGESFQNLLIAARMVEHEVARDEKFGSTEIKHQTTSISESRKSKVPAQVKVQKSASQDSKLDEILQKMEQMSSRINTLEKNRSRTVSRETGTETRTCFYCKAVGHLIKDCKKLQNKKIQEMTSSSGSGNGPQLA